VTQETDQEAGGGEEQRESPAAFCREMMRKMADCGPMMERMMASCMAMWKEDAPTAEDREPTDD
jgi:hypothetical protein